MNEITPRHDDVVLGLKKLGYQQELTRVSGPVIVALGLLLTGAQSRGLFHILFSTFLHSAVRSFRL